MMGMDLGVRRLLRSFPAAMLALSVTAALADPQYITFDAGRVVSINTSGTVTGYGWDHGFVRTPDGVITYFTISGSIGTYPASINDKGFVAGTYRGSETGFPYHGFLRAPNGFITIFDAAKTYKPDSGGTFVTGIDNKGHITGYVEKSSRHEYGFIRSPQGKITKIDCGTRGTTSLGMNSDRTIVGICYGNGGYLRAPDGTFTMLGDLYPVALNDAGSVTGRVGYGPGVGFLRAPDGTVATFDPSDGQGWGTKALAVNSGNVVVGSYHGMPDQGHGFLRTPDGTITSFDVPGSTGTFPAAINASGAIAGDYFTADGYDDGFIRIP
jgi:hypothetical protein